MAASDRAGNMVKRFDLLRLSLRTNKQDIKPFSHKQWNKNWGNLTEEQLAKMKNAK